MAIVYSTVTLENQSLTMTAVTRVTNYKTQKSGNSSTLHLSAKKKEEKY